MAKSKASGLRGQALKTANAAISKLRQAGLYHGKAARGQPTRYALSLINKFQSVVQGTASIASAPRGKELRELKEKLAGSGVQFKSGKAVIEKNVLNAERARYSKKEKTLVVYGIGEGGKTYKREILKGSDLKGKPQRGFRREYRIHFPSRPLKKRRKSKEGKTAWASSINEIIGIDKYQRKLMGKLDQFIEFRDIQMSADEQEQHDRELELRKAREKKRREVLNRGHK